MVYSAMKLFMEVNPTLFDECSNQYRDEEDQSYKRQQTRDAKWARLQELAQQRQGPKSGRTSANGNINSRLAASRSPPIGDRSDGLTHDQLRKFDQMRISDDAQAAKATAR